MTLRSNSSRDAVAPHLEQVTNLTGFQVSISTASIGGMLVRRPMRLRSLSIGVGTTGSSGDTTVQVHKNGSAISGAELTIGNAAANGTSKNLGLDAALVAGDRVELVVSAAASGGADLAVTVELVEDYA